MCLYQKYILKIKKYYFNIFSNKKYFKKQLVSIDSKSVFVFYLKNIFLFLFYFFKLTFLF